MSMFDVANNNISVLALSSNVVLYATASVAGWYHILGNIRFDDNIAPDSGGIWAAHLSNGATTNYEENQYTSNSLNSIRPFQNLQVSGVFHANANSYFKLCFFAGKATTIKATRMRVLLLQRD